MSSRIQEDNVIENNKIKLKDELLKILPKTDNALLDLRSESLVISNQALYYS